MARTNEQRDAKYSHRDFTGNDLSERTDMDGLTIYASCFSQEAPDSLSLPSKLSGTTFIRCNLDNVFIPPGNTVVDCTQRRFKVQNDGHDWLIDEGDLPTKPVNYRIFEKRGLPLPKPEDIPVSKSREALEARDLVSIAELNKSEAPK